MANKTLILSVTIVALTLLSLPSCRQPIIQGIAKDTWYISDELGIAVKFESVSHGKYIRLNRAIATPQPFKVSRSRNNTRLRLMGYTRLQGRLSVSHNQFFLTRKGERIAFRQYETPAFISGPVRYNDEVFNKVDLIEVIYGQARGFYSSRSIEKRENKSYYQVIFEVTDGITSNPLRRSIPLDMDIYQPAGDWATNRPVVVLLHAGAFIAGDKRDELVSKLAENFTRRGYVVASVNYRLGYLFVPGRYSNLERAIYSAMQDVRAAIRYLSHYHSYYRIDPEFVIIAGHSAGGILSLKVAYMDDTEVWPSTSSSILPPLPDLGCLDCSTNELHGPFTVRGVVNMWGAVTDLEIIKPHNQVPLLSIHGNQDKIVPYGYDRPFSNVSTKASAFFSRRVHGSASIMEHTRKLGLDHTLYTFEGFGHEPHFDENNELIPGNYQIIEEQILGFINQQLIPPIDSVWGPRDLGAQDPPAEYWIELDQYNTYYFQCDNCLILDQKTNSARVLWLEKRDSLQLRIAGVGPHQQLRSDTLYIRVTL